MITSIPVLNASVVGTFVLSKRLKQRINTLLSFTYPLFTMFLIASGFSLNALAQEDHSSPNAKPTIIALSPHIVEMLYDIGAGKQIIGTTEFSDYPEQAKEIPRIGNYIRIQLERVISLQPDLIIAWKTGSPSDDLERLSKLGFNIVYSNPQVLDDISKELRYFGQLTGHVNQASLVADKFDVDLIHIKETYKNKSELLGFYELWDNPLTTISKGSWPQQLLNICKVNNPFKNVPTAYPQVNIEEVLQQPLQIIIQPLSLNQPDKKGFNWHKWPVIPAVKDNHIVKADADLLHRMTIRSINALEELCENIDEVRSTL